MICEVHPIFDGNNVLNSSVSKSIIEEFETTGSLADVKTAHGLVVVDHKQT